LLTKHSANGPGADTYMYAQVWDGGTTSWGNLITLASWAGTADAGAQNLDGAYLSGGDFLLVFDNNDNTPLYRTWDGTTWSSAAGTLDVGGNPTWLHVAGRSGTNEAMMTTFDTGNDTNTALFDGTSWGGLTEHADPGDSPGFDQFDLAEFTWSQSDLTRGGLIYNEANDSAPNIRIFDRTGGAFGSWGGTVENISIGANVQAATVEDNPAALEYVGCFEDANADITCLESDTTPSWSSPTNGVLDTDTGPGTERSFDFVYERVGGDRGLALYSGGNGSPRQFPKYRTYDPSTNTFSTDTAMVTIGDLLEAVELIADPRSDDIMAVMGATDQDVWTVVWDGSSNVFVTTLGAALTEHGTNGTGDSDFWFDFAWNEF
ncbi:MAG: hypothetical protein Q8P33_02555, partial [bacterium]|nr:hypothetical protein [bacterium]